MAETVYVLAAVTLVLALAGGFLPIFSKWGSNPERLKMSTGIAAGILLASAMMVVIPEGFELATTAPASGGDEFGPLVLGGAILAGFLMMLILEGSGIGHAVHEEHHDHSHDHGHGHVHHQTSTWMLILGLSLHSAADGLAIGAAAAGGVVAVTALVTFAVLVHKVPAAFSLGVFSLHERRERKDAIRDVVLFSLATPVMILLSFHAFAGVEVQVIGLAMLFAAGTFLYVATVDTLPDIHNSETGKAALKHVLIGATILVLIFFAAYASGMLEHIH
jgi:zinc transporter 9